MEFITEISGLDSIPETADINRIIPRKALRSILWEYMVNNHNQKFVVNFRLNGNGICRHRQTAMENLEAAISAMNTAEEEYEIAEAHEDLCLDALNEAEQELTTAETEAQKFLGWRSWLPMSFYSGSKEFLEKSLAVVNAREKLEIADEAYSAAWETALEKGRESNEFIEEYGECLDEFMDTPDCWELGHNGVCTGCGSISVTEIGLVGSYHPDASDWYDTAGNCTSCEKPLQVCSFYDGKHNNGLSSRYWYICDCHMHEAKLAVDAHYVYTKSFGQIFGDKYCGKTNYEFPHTTVDTAELWRSFSLATRNQAVSLLFTAERLGWRVVSPGIMKSPDPATAIGVMAVGVNAIHDLAKKSAMYTAVKPVGFKTHKIGYNRVMFELLMRFADRQFYRSLYGWAAMCTADIAKDLEKIKEEILYNRAMFLRDINTTIPKLTPVKLAENRRKYRQVMKTLKTRTFYRQCNQELKLRQQSQEIQRQKEIHTLGIFEAAKYAKKRRILTKIMNHAKILAVSQRIQSSFQKTRFSETLEELKANWHGILKTAHMKTIVREIPDLAETAKKMRYISHCRRVYRLASLVALKRDVSKLTLPSVETVEKFADPTEPDWVDSMYELATNLMGFSVPSPVELEYSDSTDSN